jgi:transposase
MLGFGSQQRYYLYRDRADMRKGHHGLCGLVRNEMGSEPKSGDVYVFFGHNRRIVKMLVWDKDGYVVYGKNLERGSFEQISEISEGKSMQISYHHLVMLLSGISLLGHHQRRRYDMGKVS